MRTQKFKPIAWLLASIWLGMQFAPAAAADGDSYLGVWTGTWEAQDSSGRFEFTFKRVGDGKITGTIAVTTDGGANADYTVPLKNPAFKGDKFSAAFDPPGDNRGEINLTGIFNPSGAGGEWLAVATDEPAHPSIANGTWKVSKKR
jgi:hypothetical protein